MLRCYQMTMLSANTAASLRAPMLVWPRWIIQATVQQQNLRTLITKSWEIVCWLMARSHGKSQNNVLIKAVKWIFTEDPFFIGHKTCRRDVQGTA